MASTTISPEGRERAPGPHRRRHDGLQARAGRGRRRHGQGGRRSSGKKGIAKAEKRAGQERLAGAGGELHPPQQPGRACCSSSTARPTSWPAPTSSSSSRARSPCTSRPPIRSASTPDDIPADLLERERRIAEEQVADGGQAGEHPGQDRRRQDEEVRGRAHPAGAAVRARTTPRRSASWSRRRRASSARPSRSAASPGSRSGRPDGPGLHPRPAQALGRGAGRRQGLRPRLPGGRGLRRGDQGGARARRAPGARGRRRQHHPRRHRQPRGARPGLRRLHGHAGHGHQRPRAAGRAGEDRGGDPGHDGHPDGIGGGALHPPPGHPPPGEGPAHHLRRRHRQPVLLHRHRRRAPGARDRGAR